MNTEKLIKEASEPQAVKIQHEIEKALKNVPFIKHTKLSTDFHDDLTVYASSHDLSSDKFEKDSSFISITIGKDFISFEKILASNEGQGLGTQMVKAVHDTIINSDYKDKPVYVDVYNTKFWNKMKEKFSNLNWKF